VTADPKVYTKENPLVVFKMLKADGSAPWGKGKWPLPKGGERGDILRARGTLAVCANGLHGFKGTLSMVRSRLFSEALFVAELWGDMIEEDYKVCVRFGRICYKVEGWNETTARLFAADCAEHVLANFTTKYPNDKRPALAIFAARQRAFDFVYDSAADRAACSAACSAAHRAACSAADRAAYSAAYRAADSAAHSAADRAADSAAHSAADSAAHSAAYSAADRAADSAETEWQAQRLNAYLTGAVDLEAIKESVRPKEEA